MKTSTPYGPFPTPPDITNHGYYIGTSGYYYDDWIGIFNPPKLRAKQKLTATESEIADQDRLKFYQHYFSFVEINNTFYTEPLIGNFIDIESRSKSGMMYAVKVHKSISHSKENDVDFACEAMRRHITAVSPLIESGRFYSFLIQLDDHVWRSRPKLDYLLAVASEAVRSHCDVHIEFRHISWHDVTVFKALQNAGIGVCNTDIPAVEHAFPLKAYATTDKGYIRYSGRNKANWHPTTTPSSHADKIATRNARYNYEYSNEELAELVKGQQALHAKTARIAVAYNNHFQAQAIRNAIANINLLFSYYTASATPVFPAINVNDSQKSPL